MMSFTMSKLKMYVRIEPLYFPAQAKNSFENNPVERLGEKTLRSYQYKLSGYAHCFNFSSIGPSHVKMERLVIEYRF